MFHIFHLKSSKHFAAINETHFPTWLGWVGFVVLVLSVSLCLEALVIKASLCIRLCTHTQSSCSYSLPQQPWR